MDDESARVSNAPDSPAANDPPPWVSTAIRQGISWAIGGILLTLAALWVIRAESNLVRYLVIAELLALALEPAVISLHEKRGWRRGSATALLLLGVLLVVVVFAILVGSVLAREANHVISDLPQYIDKLNRFTRDAFNTTVVSSEQRAEAANAAENIRAYIGQHTGDILGGAVSALGSIFTVFTVGLFTFYLTAQGPQVRRALLSRMRPEKQRRALFAWETAIRKVGGYLYTNLLLAAINGSLMFITLLLVGAPFALPLAIFEGLVAEFIPIVGTYVAGAVPAIVVLAEVGPTAALVVVIEIVVYQQVENYILTPRISGKELELNPGIAFAAAIAGGAVGGFIGAFFALPIAATITAFSAEYSQRYEVEESDLTRVEETPSEPKEEKKKGMRERLRRRKDDAPSGATDDAPKT